MRDHVNRLVELYRDGGIQEVARGVTDYLIFDTEIPLHKPFDTAFLTVGDVRVELNLTSSESLWRVRGHGERAILSDFVDRIEPGTVVWDVGANVGTYSLLAAARDATVIAFEPGRVARERLEKNAETNGFTSIQKVRVALSNQDGYARLSEPERTGTRQISNAGTPVKLMPGDRLGYLPSPDVIKIDVEGHEREVLDGMPEVLDNASTVYIEVHEGVPDIQVMKRLGKAGYTITETWNERENETHYRLDK